MAGTDANKPIIIKKVKKGGHHGHHGGAWKVAYADFVTAMMAFFLLLWLLNATTDEQKRGIADYFSPTAVAQNTSGAGGVLGGTSLSRDGTLSSDRSPVGITISLTPDTEDEPSETDPEDAEDTGQAASGEAVSDEELERQIAEREAEKFAQAEESLRQAIQAVPELQDLAKQLLVDQTPEGMRIQIVDRERVSMFPSGSAEMFGRTRQLMGLVANAIGQLPNRIAIKGHTDATPFSSGSGYSNWELSTDRANASRRALIRAGLKPSRIESVVGRADQEPLLADEPYSPRNRRISIILLSGKTSQAERTTGKPPSDG